MVEIRNEMIGGGNRIVIGRRIMGHECDEPSQLNHELRAFSAIGVYKNINAHIALPTTQAG